MQSPNSLRKLCSTDGLPVEHEGTIRTELEQQRLRLILLTGHVVGTRQLQIDNVDTVFELRVNDEKDEQDGENIQHRD